MADRYKEIKENICRYSEVDSEVKAVIAIGSTTRESVKADEYSDIDLIIVTDNPTSWYSGEYPKLLGEISIEFVEPTLGNGKEYRAVYDEDKDVDMIIFTPEQFTEAVKNGTAGWVMNRGYTLPSPPLKVLSASLLAGIWPGSRFWISAIRTAREKETRSSCCCVIPYTCHYLLPNTEREAGSN